MAGECVKTENCLRVGLNLTHSTRVVLKSRWGVVFSYEEVDALLSIAL